jgi:hypothetical protein
LRAKIRVPALPTWQLHPPVRIPIAARAAAAASNQASPPYSAARAPGVPRGAAATIAAAGRMRVHAPSRAAARSVRGAAARHRRRAAADILRCRAPQRVR